MYAYCSADLLKSHTGGESERGWYCMGALRCCMGDRSRFTAIQVYAHSCGRDHVLLFFCTEKARQGKATISFHHDADIVRRLQIGFRLQD